MLAGFAPPDAFGSIDANVNASIRSFRPMSAAEAENVRPNRLDFYVARGGDTWESIAARAGKGIVRASQLAIMNGYRVDEPPRAGERLKIVVAG
jgi:predicted Zn-dependent protease